MKLKHIKQQSTVISLASSQKSSKLVHLPLGREGEAGLLEIGTGFED